MAEEFSAGEIITKETADRDFGEVSFSLIISSDQLKQLAAKTSKLLMFNFINKSLVILGDDRKPLYPEETAVSAVPVFTVYSKEKVLELIKTGGDNNNFVELRSEKLTITNGNATLEFGSFCPPWCSY